MMKPLLQLSILLFLLTGCGYDTPEEFIEKQKDEFKPVEHIDSPLVFPSHNLVLYPFQSNHIKIGERILPFAMKEGGGYSSGEWYRSNAEKNFFIRNINETGKPFRRLFQKDLLILEYRSFTSYGFFSEKRADNPYVLFHVVEADSNGNGIYDPENDLKSLYLLEMKTLSLKKISPEKTDIRHYSVSLKDNYSEEYSGDSYSHKQRTPITSYTSAIITFTGSSVSENGNPASENRKSEEKEPREEYIYHLKSGILERIKFPN